MRPLFYDFPEDKKAWDVEDAYMFGPALLIAPILYEKTFERAVYLPKGRLWTEVNSQETYEGGQWVKAEAPMESIPVFTCQPQILEIFKG